MRIHRWRVAGLFTESVGASPRSLTISGGVAAETRDRWNLDTGCRPDTPNTLIPSTFPIALLPSDNPMIV